jgi:hypothetical protein
MKYLVITAATEEPIDLDSLKSSPMIRASGARDDAWFENAIKSARDAFEKFSNRITINTIVDLYLDSFDSEEIEVPGLNTLTTINYYNSLNVLTLLAATVYEYDLYSEPPRIRLAYGQTWPITYDKVNAIVIRCNLGWSSSANVPQLVKDGIMLHVQEQYDGVDRSEAYHNCWWNYRYVPI